MVLPVVLIVITVGGTTLLMLLGGNSSGSGVPVPASVVNPHPAAGSFVPDDTQIADCADDTGCLEQAFGNLAYDDGPQAAFRVFDRESASDGPVQADCHRIAHYMGAAALARDDGNVGEAFSQGSSSCWSGYYHGILERAFADVPAEDRSEVARRLCAEIRDQGTFLTFQCMHGLGHGLMITTGYDLPSALSVCGDLETNWDRDSCRGGVFMENIATAAGSPIQVTGKPQWLSDDDLLYPCDDDRLVVRASKDQCYIMATSRILQANGYDFRGAAGWCLKAERRWVGTCFQSLGRDSSGASTYDPEATVRHCRAAAGYLDLCLWGAARDYTARYAGGPQAGGLCRAVPANLRRHCFTGIGTALVTTFDEPARRAAACGAISGRFRSACMLGVAHGDWAANPPRPSPGA